MGGYDVIVLLEIWFSFEVMKEFLSRVSMPVHADIALPTLSVCLSNAKTNGHIVTFLTFT